MVRKTKMIPNLVAALLSLTILILIILNPENSLTSALEGLKIWINIVLPALLPFFIVSELLIRLGFIDLISSLFNPIMKPLFNCPGNCSFVWIISMTSGYPMGAKLIGSLYKKGSITKMEGQRMLAFCSTSGPLFMIGAVGIGMLGSPEAGKLIAISHYLGAFILGLLFRFYGRNESAGNIQNNKFGINSSRSDGLPYKPFQNNAKHRESLGAILGNAVRDSIHAQLLIGGFIILFSVIINLMFHNSVPNNTNSFSNNWVFAFPSKLQLLKSMGAGIFEMTKGCQITALSGFSLVEKLLAISFIIGWGGFSIHSQAISFLIDTKFSLGLYFLSKLIHGILSALITYLLLPYFNIGSVPAFSHSQSLSNVCFYNTFIASLYFLLSSIFVLVALYLIYILFGTITNRDR